MEKTDGDDRRRGPTAMADRGDQRATTKAKLTGVTDEESEETWPIQTLGGQGNRDQAAITVGHDS